MTKIPKMQKGDWIVFANGLGVYTYSQVTRTPRKPRSTRAPIATVDTIDGSVYQRLVRDSTVSSKCAKLICDELNMEGE